MTQEFCISVTLVRGDEYLVRTERVAPGVPLAEELVSWPLEAWLTQASQLMNDPLMGLFERKVAAGLGNQHRTLALSAALPNLVTLGQQFYSGLFQGTLRDSWMCAQGIAQHGRQVLQLRLGLKDRRLHRLPWEVLHAGDRPLASGTDVVFSRYQPGTNLLKPVRPRNPNEPLKILVAIAAPSDRDSLQLKREVLHLQEELSRDRMSLAASHRIKRLGKTPEIQLTILEQPDREQLTQALEQGRYHVLHYAGHSQLGVSGGELCLVSGRTGLTETLRGDDLAGLLVNNGIQMVVFNSCRGAYMDDAAVPPDDSGQRNLAEALVQRGIPGVLAMAERIPDEVSLTLTRLLYRNINQGYPVDLSLSRARQGLISAYGSHQLYWALPILYLHPDFDGYLMESNRGSEGVQPPQKIAANDSLAAENYKNKPQSLDEFDILDEDHFEELSDQFHQEEEWTDRPVDAQIAADLFRQLTQGNSSHSHPSSPTPEENPPPIFLKPKSPLLLSKSPPQKVTLPPKFALVPALGKIVVPLTIFGAIMALGIGWWQHRGVQPGDILPNQVPVESVSPHVNPSFQPVNLKTAGTAMLTALAIEAFNQNDMTGGGQVVEVLLNRGAIPFAKAALANIPDANSNAYIYFLRGRLVWEFVQQGNKDYSISDARRYWETAAKIEPNSLEYRNALGFAYYEEGNWDRAYQTWLTVSQLSDTSATDADLEILNAKAGLALVLMKSAKNLPQNQRVNQVNKAMDLQQSIMAEAPLYFQENTLGNNWMWSEAAIHDWVSLMQK